MMACIPMTLGETESAIVERLEKVALKAGLHPIAVAYFQDGGSHTLEISWKGPGFEKQVVPASVLFHD